VHVTNAVIVYLNVVARYPLVHAITSFLILDVGSVVAKTGITNTTITLGIWKVDRSSGQSEKMWRGVRIPPP
jgi:hypothetical protein